MLLPFIQSIQKCLSESTEEAKARKEITMANAKGIPVSVVQEIEMRVDAFNKKHMAKKDSVYVPKIKGKYVYLMRTMYDDSLEHVCRLKYGGNIDSMDFAIYRYSIEAYDSDAWGFDGEKFVDGTLEGAMKAGLEAYPV